MVNKNKNLSPVLGVWGHDFLFSDQTLLTKVAPIMEHLWLFTTQSFFSTWAYLTSSQSGSACFALICHLPSVWRAHLSTAQLTVAEGHVMNSVAQVAIVG